MSERRLPVGRVAPQGPLVGGLRETAEQQGTADTDAPRRSFGAPSEGLVTADRNVAYGDLAWCDPTQATGSKLTIYLPKGEARYIGEKVTVKNYSDSTNTIRVLPVAPDTIDKDAYKDMAIAWELATFLLVAKDKWICFKGDGCL